ncbi:hypothetical protein HMPREF1546_04002 [Oscillibacter sp. KLE 1745]|nr:hypothetical protein HMPREF1546_04002 [Oscillibacter sp. KLE 1745]
MIVLPLREKGNLWQRSSRAQKEAGKIFCFPATYGPPFRLNRQRPRFGSGA